VGIEGAEPLATLSLNPHLGRNTFHPGASDVRVTGLKATETWVKAPPIRGARILLAAECVKNLYPEVFEELAKDRVVLTCCPEAENPTLLMGKLASMITCSKPVEITVASIEGSPHCLLLHMALNEALFVAKARDLVVRHYVVLDGRLIEVSEEAARLARYLHLVQKALEKCPELLEELGKYSLEHRWASGRQDVP